MKTKQITINDVNADVSTELKDQILMLIKDLRPKKCHPIYIELWNEEEFRNYFTKGKDVLQQPIGEDKQPEGSHQYTELDGILTHQIALIVNSNWQKTLTHEMIHVYCAEIAGVNVWGQIGNIFQDKRNVDPFEYVAIVLADPDIVYRLEGNMLMKGDKHDA